MSLQPNLAASASSSRLQQRRPSRSSATDTTEAAAFRARLASTSHQQHFASSSHAIVEDDEDPQEQDRSKHDDSKGTSDEEEAITPPILTPTYPPTAARRPSSSTSSSNGAAPLVDLPPIDGGSAAWRFVLCGFVIWSMVWGIAYSYGSFQDYHEHNPESPFYGQSVTSISAVGTLVIGCQHFVPLLLRGFTTTYAHLHRKMVMVSLVLSALSILVASFSTSIAMLIAFQGVFFGITSGVLLTPVVLYLGQWFDKRRGFATSAIFMGSGVGGVVFPLVLNALLTSVGFAWTMHVWALAQLLLNGTALYLVKPRIPTPRTSKKLPSSTKEVLRLLVPGDLRPLLNPIALIYFVVIMLQAFGWYIVSLYISTYATALGFSSTVSTGLLSAFNASAIIGYLITGPAIDKLSFTLAMAISSGLCAITALLLFGFATSLTIVLVFVLVFGAAGGGFGCFLTPIARDVATVTNSDNALQFLAWMFIRGTAAVSGPLVGSALYRPSVVTPHPHGGEYGINGFRDLILFVGASMLVAAVAALVASFWRKRG
ncbi:related to monocarboxylate transporter 2 [Sporisorium reilianum SRZ2]|uniref:Related to monocarboxylate transporter 2 n=1 Tax=Sporisorium reilianum (strain SRZ2) TaxID=999809 RepID=E6ZRK0_SPORE|nr:related to monocarboxylate transporter 2 [Sporisorium reilianum SRZ2]